MKQCLVCGEPLDDHALKCSKGHSLFETERGKGFSEEERHIVEDMLRQSSRGYKDDEIVYLVDKIIKICRDAGSRVTKALVETIGANIENRHQQRQSKIRPTWPRPGSGEERQQQEAIARVQRCDRENTARRERLLNIEDGLPVFRGINDRGVSREDLTELLADAVNVLVYDRLRYPRHPRYPDTTAPVGHVYNDNQSFWDDALGDRLVQGMRIRLARFHLMEWIPSAPGRYFTHEAKRAREEAKRYLMFEREYLPLGKQNMVLGGIGSIRLGARDDSAGAVYPLCASSTGISHQGIPVIMPAYQYRRVVEMFRESRGCLTNLVGHLKVIPRGELPIEYDTSIPRYVLFVDDIQIIEASARLLVTVAITFSADNNLDHKLWSFCSFDPARENAREAAVWLKDYTLRYSEIRDPIILSDFDEHHTYFENLIEFPLQQVRHGQISQRLAEYGEKLCFTTINIGEYTGMNQDFRGAIFTTTGGQQFVGMFNDTIANLTAAGQQEFRQVLTGLAHAVATSNQLSEQQKQKTLEDLKRLGDEAAKAQPDKSLVRVLGDGLMIALRAVPDVAKAVTALGPILAKIVG